MQKFNLEAMTGGWFVGAFSPAAYFTDEFEVCYKFHKKGEFWETHYHKQATEINLLIRGEMLINKEKIWAGQIFVIPPYYISTPEFLTDCELVVIKTPSVKDDKYIIK